MRASSDYFVIFGGGGIRGISYVGALQALIENNVNITGYAGSSIGSVFASLCAVGYKISDIKEFFYGINIEFFKDINFNFGSQIALSRGELFLEWMREKIEFKFYGDDYIKDKMAPVCFKDLENDLIIYSVDITNGKFNEFSKYKTPDFEIALAIRASVSMPGLFKPLEIDDKFIVDGDLMKSWPLWRLSDNLRDRKERIIEFRLEDNGQKRNISNALDYLNAVYNTISGSATDYIIDVYANKDKFEYIKINTDNISVLDFNIPMSKKEFLVQVGYETTKEYFEEFLPKKHKNLCDDYTKIKFSLLKMKEKFNKQKNKEAYLILCEIFVEICKQKKTMDTQLYKMISDLQTVFSQNLKETRNIFLVKQTKILNLNYIAQKIDDTIYFVSKKIDELKD